MTQENLIINKEVVNLAKKFQGKAQADGQKGRGFGRRNFYVPLLLCYRTFQCNSNLQAAA